MPLVRIDVLEGRSPEALARLGDAVHRGLIESIGIPPADRFQVISSHRDGTLVYDPGYLGIARTRDVVFVQITMSVGRTLELRKALHAALARNLAAEGVRPEDVFIVLVEVAKENWSFGNGIAQYAT